MQHFQLAGETCRQPTSVSGDWRGHLDERWRVSPTGNTEPWQTESSICRRKVSLSIGKTWNTCLFLVAHTDKWQIKGKKTWTTDPYREGTRYRPLQWWSTSNQYKVMQKHQLNNEIFLSWWKWANDDNIPNHWKVLTGWKRYGSHAVAFATVCDSIWSQSNWSLIHVGLCPLSLSSKQQIRENVLPESEIWRVTAKKH